MKSAKCWQESQPSAQSALVCQRIGANGKIALPANDLIPGVNSWVIDTGSGHNLAPAKSLSLHEMQNLSTEGPALKLATANGVISDRRVTESQVGLLGTVVETRVLDSTPRMLSVAQLVAAGNKFVWDSSGASLTTEDGVIDLEVKQGVPLLSLPAVPTRTSESSEASRN